MATTVVDLDTVKHSVLEELERQALRPRNFLTFLAIGIRTRQSKRLCFGYSKSA